MNVRSVDNVKYKSGRYVNLYIFGSIAYVILVPTTITVNMARTLIIVCALPQVLLYMYKIISRREFKFKKLKFLVRSLFIIAFFFALLNFMDNIYLNTVIVVTGTSRGLGLQLAYEFAAMNTARTNILKAICFDKPDHIPMIFHINEACWNHYPCDEIKELMADHKLLFPDFQDSPGRPEIDYSIPERVGKP